MRTALSGDGRVEDAVIKEKNENREKLCVDFSVIFLYLIGYNLILPIISVSLRL